MIDKLEKHLFKNAYFFTLIFFKLYILEIESVTVLLPNILKSLSLSQIMSEKILSCLKIRQEINCAHRIPAVVFCQKQQQEQQQQQKSMTEFPLLMIMTGNFR